MKLIFLKLHLLFIEDDKTNSLRRLLLISYVKQRQQQ